MVVSMDRDERDARRGDTHIMDGTDVNLAGLLGGVGRGHIGLEWMTKSFDITTLCLDGDLLTSALSLERGSDRVGLPGRRQGRCGSGLCRRVMAIAGEGRGGTGRNVVIGSACMGAGDRLDVIVDRRADVFSPATLGGLTLVGVLVVEVMLMQSGGVGGNDMTAGGVTVGELAALVGLGLGGVVDDNNLLGEAVAVKGVPVGLVGAASLAGGVVGLGGRHGGAGHAGGEALVGRRAYGRCVARHVQIGMGRGRGRLV